MPRSSSRVKINEKITVASLAAATTLAVLPGCSKGGEMDGVRAPEIVVQSEGQWINSKPLSMKELEGKVVMIDIWDYTCVNCIRTLPYIKSWHERYADAGLVIIGVHAPEFEFAKTKENVQDAVDRFDIKYPVVMDNEFKIWQSYANMYWPRKYLIDEKGYIRYDHVGEGGYTETEREIQKLLAGINPEVDFPEPLPDTSSRAAKGKACYPMTPELYMGYQRGRIGNKEGYKPEKIVDYSEPDTLKDGFVYARGAWYNRDEAMVHARETSEPEDYIGIHYHALEVNAVIKPETDKPYKVWVKHNDDWVREEDAGADIYFASDGRTYLEITEPRMYRIINNSEYGNYELKLYSTSEGFGIYAFTFGSCR
ncbi:redoxin domain-containing protein [candidate division WOR-3 bacterium]|nr:redoxin domain-containing protein [candidate division WOR-3 bacterium]